MLLPVLEATVTALSAPGQLAELRIDNAVAKVVVIPEARGGVSVAVQQSKSGPPLTIRREGAAIVVDGGQPQAGRSLVPTWLAFATRWVGKRRCAADNGDAARITAHVPLNARISVSGAVAGEIGPSANLSFNLKGCGDWRLGPVQRELSIDAASAGRVSATSVGGALAIQTAGPGDVAIDGGHIPTARIIVLGAGNVTHKGSLGGLVAQVKSSGVVRVKEIYGVVDAEVNGTGDVFYARPAAKRACGTGRDSC